MGAEGGEARAKASASIKQYLFGTSGIQCLIFFLNTFSLASLGIF